MRRRRTALDLRARLAAHIEGFEPIRKRYARLRDADRPYEPDPLIAALRTGEPVKLPAWRIAAALPEVAISLLSSDPQFYVVEPDGTLTPIEIDEADHQD